MEHHGKPRRITAWMNTEHAAGSGGTYRQYGRARFINHFTLGADAYEYVGNPFLRPEPNHQVEWSLSRQSERFGVKLSAFYYITDYITAAVDSTLFASICRWNNPGLPPFSKYRRRHAEGFELEPVQLMKNSTVRHRRSTPTPATRIGTNPYQRSWPFSATAGLKYEHERYPLTLCTASLPIRNGSPIRLMKGGRPVSAF